MSPYFQLNDVYVQHCKRIQRSNKDSKWHEAPELVPLWSRKFGQSCRHDVVIASSSSAAFCRQTVRSYEVKMGRMKAQGYLASDL